MDCLFVLHYRRFVFPLPLLQNTKEDRQLGRTGIFAVLCCSLVLSLADNVSERHCFQNQKIMNFANHALNFEEDHKNI